MNSILEKIENLDVYYTFQDSGNEGKPEKN